MLVRDVMCRFPTIVSPQVECREALEIGRRSDAHFLLVVDENRLLGIARACDLLRAPPEHLVARSLRVPVVTVAELEPVQLARRVLTQTAGGSLVVVDRFGDLKGLITFRDLTRARGTLRDVRERCEACGNSQHLIFGQPDDAVFCCSCVEHGRAALPVTRAGS